MNSDFYRQLFVSNPMPMWIVDADTKQFLEVNDKALLHYGYSRDEFLRMTLRDIRPIVDIPKLGQIEWTTEGGNTVYHGQWKHYKKNGDLIDVEITSHRIDYNGRAASLVLINDITERQSIEDQKEFERSNKEALINSTDDMIWSVDKNYHLIIGNRAFLERMYIVTGLRLHPGDHLLMKDKYSPDHLLYWEMLYNRAFAGESFKVETHSDHADPQLKSWWDISLNPIYREAEVIAIACYARNITQRTNDQYQLLRLNQNLKTAQKIAKLGYWELDLLSGSLYWTDEVYNIWGTSPYFFSVNLENFRNSIHPDDQEEFVVHQAKALSGESELDFEHRIVLPDGTIRYVHERGSLARDRHGNAVRLEGTVQDITERKKAGELIRYSEEQRRLIMNAALDAIVCMDLSGNITFWNPQAEKTFGWTEEEAIGKKVSTMIIPASFRELHEEALANYRITGTGSMLNTVAELSAVNKAGKEFPIELTILPIRQGGEEYFCAFIRDISERKKSEEKLFAINEELSRRAAELAASNAELERFAYIASHDLQEPLRMVTSFLQLLEKKYSGQLDGTARQYIHFAVDGATRMKMLIQDLLEYSRAGSEKEHAGNTDMNEVLREVLLDLRSKIEEQDAEIIAADLPVLPGTRKTQLAQLMQNLIGNALKYHGTDKPLIRIGATEEPDQWVFSVSDNGIGIDEMFTEKIFILFQRLHNKNEYSGTGIGLAICKKIVEQHNGKIWVESVKGQGSSFYFSIGK